MATSSPGPVFWLLAAVIVVSSLGVVMARNMVHSALCLGVMLLMVGGLYLNLGADLLAGFQVLIYVGAVVTLVLIAIMLIHNIASRQVLQTNTRWGWAALLSTAVGGLLIWVLTGATWFAEPHPAKLQDYEGRLKAVCYALLDKYLLPFEVASVLLLVALVGAVVIAQQTQERKG